MAEQIPVKVIRLNGNTVKLGEFEPTDTFPVGHVPDIIDLNGVPLTDFNNHLAASNPHAITPAIIGSPATADFTVHQNTTNAHGVTALNINAIAVSEKGAVNGVATLDANNTVPIAQLPARAIPDFKVVADEAARLALTVQEGDQAKQLDTGVIWIYDGATWYQDPYPTSIFGEGFSYANEAAVSVTTSTTYQTKATLSFPTKTAQTYRYDWCYFWSHDSTTNDFEMRILMNGGLFLHHKQEAKDSAGSHGNTGTSQKHPAAGHDYYSPGQDETTEIKLQYRTDVSGQESSIWECRLSQYRVL